MRTPLQDLTFVIPVRIDSPHRVYNLDAVVEYLLRNFETTVIVYEHGPAPLYKNRNKITHIFEQNDGPFHRTRCINNAVRLATTKIVAVHDSDALLNLAQITKAYFLIRSSAAAAVIPYDNFVCIPPNALRAILHDYNISNLNVADYANRPAEVGGSVFWNKGAFMALGLENEYMISWGPDAQEIYDRATKLGYNVTQISGPLWHIEHVRSIESGPNHPHYLSNVDEHMKAKYKSPEELKEYIQTWPWLYLNPASGDDVASIPSSR